MNRRYLHSSIHELETLFENRKDEGSVLKALQDELAHRKTERAVKLRERVVMRLTQLETCPSASTLRQHPPQFERAPIIKNDPILKTHANTLEVPQKSADYPDLTSTALRARVKNHSQQAIPPLTNAPEAIMSAWTALEVLSPQTFRKPEDLATGDRSLIGIDTAELPWERGEKSRPKRRLYYQIVLGAIRIEPALELLVERYGDTRLEKPSAPGNAALAVVIVDQQGRLTDSSAVAVSSFGWGVMAALNGELDDLALWPKMESQLVANVENILRNRVSEDADFREPITRYGLTAAYEYLITSLGLPVEWMQPPEFAIRSYTHFKDPNPPEPILLNSFFLADLSLAKVLFANDETPHNLRRYLGVERPTQTQDLLLDDETLEKAVSPQSTPLARWPGPGRNPLVLLQQAAINVAFSETTSNGLIGINGPPGTGKTTLLRDLVAGIVTQRAQAMVRFEDPETAFLPTELKLSVGQAWIHLYELSDSLKGFEIVVASSNNKAVENVSAELPGVDAIAADASLLRYFKTISDSIHGRETWGLIAAILGNAQNRYRFKQLFWWEENKDFNSYLRAVTGSLPNTKNTEQPQPTIWDEDPPTTRAEALKRWETARERFRKALDESRRWQQLLKSLRDEVIDIPRLAKADDIATQQYSEVVCRVKRLYQQYQYLTRDLQNASEELRIHASAKPGFWARLLSTKAARQWKEVHTALLDLKQTESAWKSARTEHEKTKHRVGEAQKKHGIEIADSAFFEKEHCAKHQTTPWWPIAAQRARDEVFIAAMALHRAFVDAAAKRLRHNLAALMNVFTTQRLPTAEKQALLPDLWASLFLVVPLVSTTFASVTRMLGKLPLESLGWLLVDEAGQAPPQAAVGAIMRTKRAVIVGDPIQIEPVVTLPDTLCEAICSHFGVDPERYSAPRASVQTLGDAASAYITEFEMKFGGSRTVGVPLLVHRRCAEPMFSISNSVAYSGLMVFAKKDEKPSGIMQVLGPSQWIDVIGTSEDKWCPEEGDEVVRLLYQLAQAGASSDLYVITPFVVVADGLRLTIRKSGVLRGWVDEESRWLNERVGTVHTAQGREAEAVIIVLGAPNPSQTGARNWAGGRPNILNVAITRAKEVVYVVGNRKLWCEAGVFADLDRGLS
jgi:AAA domain